MATAIKLIKEIKEKLDHLEQLTSRPSHIYDERGCNCKYYSNDFVPVGGGSTSWRCPIHGDLQK